jgi:hypothetical protein
MDAKKIKSRRTTLSSKNWKISLERKFINEYLHDRGYDTRKLLALPVTEAKVLMGEACRFASLKLAEIESRAGFTRKISTRPF